MTFVEATVLYQARDADPRDPDGQRSEKRLINLDAVRLITATADGKNRSVFYMRETLASLFVVLEPYEYWSAILTSEQPRRP